MTTFQKFQKQTSQNATGRRSQKRHKIVESHDGHVEEKFIKHCVTDIGSFLLHNTIGRWLVVVFSIMSALSSFRMEFISLWAQEISDMENWFQNFGALWTQPIMRKASAVNSEETPGVGVPKAVQYCIENLFLWWYWCQAVLTPEIPQGNISGIREGRRSAFLKCPVKSCNL